MIMLNVQIISSLDNKVFNLLYLFIIFLIHLNEECNKRIIPVRKNVNSKYPNNCLFCVLKVYSSNDPIIIDTIIIENMIRVLVKVHVEEPYKFICEQKSVIYMTD